VLGTGTLLDVIVNKKLPIKKMIVASSMSIYGEGQYRCPACGLVTPSLRPVEQLAAHDWEMRCPACNGKTVSAPTPETKPLIPTSVYAVSKRDQEELFLCVGRSYQIPTVALRYFNVYGPRQSLSNPYTGVCAIFSSRIKNTKRPIVFEDGGQSRDFVHVDDIVQANLLVMRDARADYGVFNVGTGLSVSIRAIAGLLARLYGSSIEPDITLKYRAGDIRHCYADVSRLTALGFKPSVVLEQGLKALAEWGRTVEARDDVEKAARELEARGLTKG
jgi:dTDP-L-rhamnose 4-epimerase